MSALQKRIILWAILAGVLLMILLAAFRPQPASVDLIELGHTDMTVTLEADGETRVHDAFLLSAPVTGRMRRIELHVGDPVTANQTILAEIEPGDPTYLDPRSASQAQAAVQAAESASTLAAAEVDRARADLEFATAEHERSRRLYSERTITRREAEQAERAYKTAVAALATADAALQVRQFELRQAEALLMSPEQTLNREGTCPCISLTAPVDGTVLRIPNTSARVVQAGEALLEIGDPSDLEIVADFLSADAVKISAGMAVRIENWGGSQSLAGQVRRVEPFGFTKTSALGIDEQRVNVIIDITSPADAWQRLGHGYQVQTGVILWQSSQTLTVPLTALFRDKGHWAVFKAVDGRSVLQHIEIGQRNGLVAQVLAGLNAGDSVVLHPSDRVIDGGRIRSRS